MPHKKAAQLGDLDAWTDGKVQKVLVEKRATTSEEI
jgi:hypothetical protein